MYRIRCSQARCLLLLFVLFMLECYFGLLVNNNATKPRKIYYLTTDKNESHHEQVYYKYPLINGEKVAMDYNIGYNSSYDWFMAMKKFFKNIGENETVRYKKNTPNCKLDATTLGPLKVLKNKTNLEYVEEQNPDVMLGGYYAPAHCRSTYRVAVIVPYRDRKDNLAIFLRHLHPLLKKQLLEYRIFVVEQHGTEKFNKGSLYNIAFLETQRFGSWDCLVFHDVDLIPEHEGIPYSCNQHPTHMSPAVESFGYVLPYKLIFGGVTALTPQHYRLVNGYSNFYWNWGAEDDDFYGRLESINITVSRYNSSIARYATLPHNCTKMGKERALLLMISKIRYQKEGLSTTIYKLINVTELKLYTHIVADVNPTKMKLDMKSLMQRVLSLYGQTIVYGHKEFVLSNPAKFERI
nr:beta-1,4-N-acetylgalactosaminyltransferase bre-4-like [Helicoverpa armigera]